MYQHHYYCRMIFKTENQRWKKGVSEDGRKHFGFRDLAKYIKFEQARLAVNGSVAL